MHLKTYLTFFCAFCLVALLLGCATLTTDHLPSGVAKGYVEFYKGDTTGGYVQAFTISIYELQEGKEIYMGKTGIWTRATRRRIACRPGRHTFVAKLGNAAVRVQVEVKQDEITPVRITVSPGGVAYNTYYFRMFLEPEKAVPIK